MTLENQHTALVKRATLTHQMLGDKEHLLEEVKNRCWGWTGGRA